jgi:hypothetical protein
LQAKSARANEFRQMFFLSLHCIKMRTPRFPVSSKKLA